MTEGITSSQSAGTPRSDAVLRAQVADDLPFFMRAWWLRDRICCQELVFGEQSSSTRPLWSAHSDPLCDTSNMDIYLL